MSQLLSTAEAAGVVMKVPLSAVVVAAVLLSCCLHAPCAGDEGAKVVCPLTNVVDEHTEVVAVPVVEVDPQPLTTTRLYTYIHTTSTTLTSTSCLLRDSSMPTFTAELLKTSVVTAHETLTVTQATTVVWPLTHTTTALTTTTATRLHHTTATLAPTPPPDLITTSTLVLARPFTSVLSSVPVETMVEVKTKTETVAVFPKVPAAPSTRTVTDTITYTVCPAELFIK